MNLLLLGFLFCQFYLYFLLPVAIYLAIKSLIAFTIQEIKKRG